MFFGATGLVGRVLIRTGLATQAAEERAALASASPPPHRPDRWRTVLRWGVGVGLPLAVIVGLTFMLRPPADDRLYSINNAGPGGARAVAQVLRAQGVQVDQSPTTRQATAQAGSDTTLAVVGGARLSSEQLDLIAQTEAAIVLVEPDETTRLALIGADRLFETIPQGMMLANGVVLNSPDDAARVLRVLGQHDRLVWYLATYETGQDLAPHAAGTWDLLPPWAGFAATQLAIAAGAVALWRGRRFGPLVPESLPVAVPASDAVTGLGRLYRRAQARGHTAAGLRGATAARLAELTGLAPAAPPQALVVRIAQAAGREEASVGAALYGPAPANDAELVALARQLAAIEDDVRLRTRSGGRNHPT